MGPKCHHMYPYEKEAKGTLGTGSQKCRQREDRDRDWRDVDTSQGTAAAGRARRDSFSPGPLEEPGPAHTLISDFWPPEL